MRLRFLATLPLLATQLVLAEPLTISVSTPTAPVTDGYAMGASLSPSGETITVDSRSLLLNGRRWTPAMGEFHYSRYPAAEWREELEKMKAGGIDIVATYVFWIHHEEIEGEWDWSGSKNLREFVEAAGKAGLKVIVRCGPWCHGEVRNGGLPDWIVERGRTRSEDEAFLASTRKLYEQIAAQVSGLLWKDGGPVIGIQLDNEYSGPASYLLSLKRIARDLGMDVPVYTRTGWPELSTPMPFGEIVPLYGVYAEGFWDRETTSMPGNYWAGFHFSTLRIDSNIANEALGRREVKDPDDVAQYPYLTCEIGGGMMSSYHRRILVDPRDILSTTLVKLGSGSVSPGYYMYHGGTNPDGKLTTLMEEQATALTNWNDMPVKNYDFQTALGQYGQVRPQYQTLRRVHEFLRQFGSQFAEMDAFLPDARPAGKDDVTTLRWAVRSDGERGFVFVNNHERGRELPPKDDVQFSVTLASGGTISLPGTPVTVPSGASFFWPFNLDLGEGITLAWATAQPVSIARDGGVRTVLFEATRGVVPRFCFLPEGAPFTSNAVLEGTEVSVFDLDAGGKATVTFTGVGGNRSVRIAVLPADKPAAAKPVAATVEQARPAGPLREIRLGSIKQPVAAAPSAADFENAAVWRVKLPDGFDPASTDSMLRIQYTGDVARVYIGDRFITDDYYNGKPLEIGLKRHAAELKEGEIKVEVLPLQKSALAGEAPLIFMDPTARPDFDDHESVAEVRAVEIVPR